MFSARLVLIEIDVDDVATEALLNLPADLAEGLDLAGLAGIAHPILIAADV